MKKGIVVIICVLVIIGAIYAGITMYEKKGKQEKVENESLINQTEVSEKVTDDCLEEENEFENSIDLLQASSAEEKISPNCLITFKTTYLKCGHCIKEYKDISESLINQTQKELKEKYTDWSIEKFSSNEIILAKEMEGECGEHFLVKEKEGKVVVYRINQKGEEELYQTTEIATDYLTETDRITMQDGIRVNGTEELNQLMEDFE